jgi:hypothetical protein
LAGDFEAAFVAGPELDALRAGAFAVDFAVDLDAVVFDAVAFDVVFVADLAGDLDAVDLAGDFEVDFEVLVDAVLFEAVLFDGVLLAAALLEAVLFEAVLFDAVLFEAVLFEAVAFGAVFVAALVELPVDFVAALDAPLAATAFLLGAFASFFVPLAIALNSEPARKAGTLVFFTFTEAPVAGLRAVRAALSRRSNTPNPVSATFSPFAIDA